MRKRSCREADEICPLLTPTKARPVGVQHFRAHWRLHKSQTVQTSQVCPCVTLLQAAGGIFSWPAWKITTSPPLCLAEAFGKILGLISTNTVARFGIFPISSNLGTPTRSSPSSQGSSVAFTPLASQLRKRILGQN